MKVLLFLVPYFAFNSLIGQTEGQDSSLNIIFVEDSIPIPCDCHEYECDEIEPMFPGGESALYAYVKSHSKFTPEMLELDLSGMVYVQFVIETDGGISEIKVVKGLHELYDKKAVEIISNMPTWSPGKDACGNLVRIHYTVPIKFDIN